MGATCGTRKILHSVDEERCPMDKCGELLGNGVCDEECNLPACIFDRHDCAAPEDARKKQDTVGPSLEDGGGDNTGMIVGVVCGIFCVIFIAGGGAFWHRRRKAAEGYDTSIAPGDCWTEAHDPGTGKIYYHNPATGKVSWAKPVDDIAKGWKMARCKATGMTYYFKMETGEVSWTVPSPEQGGIGPALPDGWKEATDPGTGRSYFFHKATGAVTWHRKDTHGDVTTPIMS